MKVWTFSIVCDEAQMAPWFLRHYETWVDRMVVYCEPGTDNTREILSKHPKVDLRNWPWRGLDDEKFLTCVNRSDLEAIGQADWTMFVDMDELIYHPNMRQLLEQTDCDVFQCKGYALISDGWPTDDGKSQLYELVKTGVAEPNYDKKLLHRPSCGLTHTIGRHTYWHLWPKFNGKECQEIKLKLFHCHHVGGVDHTKARNQRNYDRALDKKYAWNFAQNHNRNPKQVGSVAWVKTILENKRLEVVV